jgi:aspartyl/asparaginyl beta-hydroxylase (cupin superfamily)
MTAIDTDARPEVIGWVDHRSYAGVENLSARWREIRDEMFRLIDARVPWVHYVNEPAPDGGRPALREELVHVDHPTPRKYFPLMRECNLFPAAAQLCPRTLGVVAALPPAFNAGFATLDPGATISVHRGTSNLHDRCHLGLVVPPGDVKLKVAGEERGWNEGEVMVFNDRAWHEAWNHTAGRRFVLIVDFEKARAVNRRPLSVKPSDPQ